MCTSTSTSASARGIQSERIGCMRYRPVHPTSDYGLWWLMEAVTSLPLVPRRRFGRQMDRTSPGSQRGPQSADCTVGTRFHSVWMVRWPDGLAYLSEDRQVDYCSRVAWLMGDAAASGGHHSTLTTGTGLLNRYLARTHSETSMQGSASDMMHIDFSSSVYLRRFLRKMLPTS